MNVEILSASVRSYDLPASTYQDIYTELRGWDRNKGWYILPLRAFSAKINSNLSHAVWSKYDRDPLYLTRTMKNELRAAYGLPPLPLVVSEIPDIVHPSAEILLVDAEKANCDLVILTNRANKDRIIKKPAKRRKRRKLVRPVASLEDDGARSAIGASWKQVIQAGLDALRGE